METDQIQNTFQNIITKQEINDLPLFKFRGKVTVISKQSDVPKAIEQLRREKVLGFDTETRPSFQKGQNFPAALLQLSGANEVHLFQLLQLEDISPLTELLADESIIKVGVAIRDDIKKLQERSDFTPGGFIELSDITQKADVVNTGLRSLAGIFLNIRISKGAQVSNWSKAQLSQAQISYAATDAWVSREIYIRLLDLGLA